MTSPSTQLVDRYGAPSARRRWILVLASGAIGAVALTWLGWAAWTQGAPQVQSSLRSFSIVNAHLVKAEIEVKTASRDVRPSCLLRAYAVDHSVVGELNLRVPRSDGTRVYRTSLRTERKATAVEMVGCTAPGQSRRR